MKWIKKLTDKLFFNLFIWSGCKIYSYVAFYPNGGQNDEVTVIHWATSEATLVESCKAFIADNH